MYRKSKVNLNKSHSSNIGILSVNFESSDPIIQANQAKFSKIYGVIHWRIQKLWQWGTDPLTKGGGRGRPLFQFKVIGILLMASVLNTGPLEGI